MIYMKWHKKMKPVSLTNERKHHDSNDIAEYGANPIEKTHGTLSTAEMNIFEQQLYRWLEKLNASICHK